LETKKNFYNDFPPARMLLRACCWVAALGFSDAEGNFSIIFYKNKAPPGKLRYPGLGWLCLTPVCL